jgi:arsenite methyltransferase
VPAGSDLGLGCSNPQSIARPQAQASAFWISAAALGFDAFLAARHVGAAGSVIGVDLTPEMARRARANATNAGVEGVAFRLGEIERLPGETGSVPRLRSRRCRP